MQLDELKASINSCYCALQCVNYELDGLVGIEGWQLFVREELLELRLHNQFLPALYLEVSVRQPVHLGREER